MEAKGLNQSSVANELDVSRTMVSKWLAGAALPRPDKLLKLALLLELAFDQLVAVVEDAPEPVIAFRKRAGVKTTSAHVKAAKEKAHLLSSLVPYLPFATYTQPPALKHPSLEYGYLQESTRALRKEIGAQPDGVLEFHELIRQFNVLQAVIVPVLWGAKKHHENALHIYLPDTTTTWIYLNLDVDEHDFKFWMAHELAHTLSPNLRGEEAEDFADAFAGALLFPKTAAAKAYGEIEGKRKSTKISKVLRWADTYTISPISVMKEIDRYAEHQGLDDVGVGKDIFPVTTNFNRIFKTISQTMFDDEEISPKLYMDKCADVFETPFFNSLREFLRAEQKSSSYVHTLLDIPISDAKGIYSELG